MQVQTFFDELTYTLTHIVYDPDTHDAVIIDPVLDLDAIAWETHTTSLQDIDAFIQTHALKLHYAIDTHIHADHLTGMQYLKTHYQTPLVISAAITQVQETFKSVLALDDDFVTDGSQFDHLLTHGEQLQAGALTIKVISTPGHTSTCITLQIEDAVFTGDALLMPDIGVGRCDFPKGDSADLYHSITEKLYTLPDATRVFPGHDYPGNRELHAETTIGASKAHNIDLPARRLQADFTAMMTNRDSCLALPKLLYQSVQVNIAAGKLPPAQRNGRRYLKIPISAQ